jgi:alanine racemase
MAEPTQARLSIDLDALAHNYAVLRARSGAAEVAPVVKADGYGLGATEVARRLWSEGARSFFVARLAEGEALRDALGPQRAATVFVLDGMVEGAAERLAARSLTAVLATVAQVAAAAAWAAQSQVELGVALHLDTGMNRQGLTPAEALALAGTQEGLRGLKVGLVMSHLGSASNPDDTRNAGQLARFAELRRLFPQARASLAASAGIFLGRNYCFDLVRPGISLYGGGPLERPEPRLRAVARLTAPVLDVRSLEPGDRLGYGDAVILDRPARVAVIAAGYADGIMRTARQGGYAWAGGRRCPLLIVNMDLLAIEIGDTQLRVGEPVELLGPNAQLDDLAQAGATVAHEILVRISSRAARGYVGAR